MKVRPSVKPMCEKCKIIRRKGNEFPSCRAEIQGFCERKYNSIRHLEHFGRYKCSEYHRGNVRCSKRNGVLCLFQYHQCNSWCLFCIRKLDYRKNSKAKCKII